MKADDEPEPPLRLFTPLYWAALAFGLAMILAGAAVGLFGAHPRAHPSPDHPGGPALTAHRVRGKEPANPSEIR